MAEMMLAIATIPRRERGDFLQLGRGAQCNKFISIIRAGFASLPRSPACPHSVGRVQWRLTHNPKTKIDVAEGNARARNVVIEFPDYAAALACYRSPEYQENIKVRLPHSTGELIVIEGYDGPQP